MPSQTPQCDTPDIGVGVIDGQVTGAFISNAAPDTFTLTVTRSGTQVLSEEIRPTYTEHTTHLECQTLSCRQGNAVVLNDEPGTGGAGVGGQGDEAGSVSTGSGGSARETADCDQSAWNGKYAVTFEPGSTNCPMLGSPTWNVVNAVEQDSNCTAEMISWSATCVRKSKLTCMTETSAWVWALDIAGVDGTGGPGQKYAGTGHIKVSSPTVCEGDYKVTYQLLMP